MRVLVTNDDGVGSPGLHALARALFDAGHDVIVAAPADDRSGSSSAIGPADLTEGVPVERVELAGLEGVAAFSLDASPALIVLLARLGGMGDPPELVASGINPGPNTGRAVLHSGTVGAALTAANVGLSAVAVSIGVGDPLHWDTAASLARSAVRWLAGAPPRTVLNLNAPNLPGSELAGIREAALAPFGTVRTAITGASEGRLQVEFREVEEELDPGTDTALVTAGYVSVTALLGVRAADGADVVPWLERERAASAAETEA